MSKLTRWWRRTSPLTHLDYILKLTTIIARIVMVVVLVATMVTTVAHLTSWYAGRNNPPKPSPAFSEVIEKEIFTQSTSNIPPPIVIRRYRVPMAKPVQSGGNSTSSIDESLDKSLFSLNIALLLMNMVGVGRLRNVLSRASESRSK